MRPGRQLCDLQEEGGRMRRSRGGRMMINLMAGREEEELRETSWMQ